MYEIMDAPPGKRAYREAELLRTALEAFHHATGLQMVVEVEEVTDNAPEEAKPAQRQQPMGKSRAKKKGPAPKKKPGNNGPATGGTPAKPKGK